MTADPRQAQRFHFVAATFDPVSGCARLSYALDNAAPLEETLTFPWAPWPQSPTRQAALFRALEVLHLIAGVSYYKTAVPPHIDTGDLAVDAPLAEFLQQVYVQGLAEFAHVNRLTLGGRISFAASDKLQPVGDDPDLPARALVAMGGGKDSLVSLELLRSAGIEVQPITVGRSELIRNTVQAAGLPLIEIGRELAPGLARLNAAGAWNGHVPVTAINSAILVCAALLYGYRWVVFSNERSADEATLKDAQGKAVNHQYSKSMAFEQAYRDIIRTHISPGLEYFSLLRPLGELAVARRFSTLTAYHDVFSSCNRNFHRDGPRMAGRWCGNCPKCRFTTLALAPFMSPESIGDIVGGNLLDQPEQEAGYRALFALGDDKPFECVGTVEESRAALRHLSADPAWKSAVQVRLLAPELPPDQGRKLEDLLEPQGPHHIPDGVLKHVAF